MYLEVYPDIIFVINFILDFIILTIIKKVNQKSSPVVRRLLASAFGAIVAAILGIYPWINIIIRFILMNMVTSIIMLLITFGRMKKVDLLKQVIALYLITYFLGGLMNSFYYNTNFKLHLIHVGNAIDYSNISWNFLGVVILIVIPAALLILWVFRLAQSNNRDTYEVELIIHQHSLATKGFMDTGNCLYEPIFKKPVIIIENSILENLLPRECLQEYKEVKCGFENSEQHIGEYNIGNKSMLRFRIIPYQSIGKPQGMMLGLILDRVLIHRGKEILCIEKVTAAICDNRLSTKEEYHVILHKGLF